MTDGTVAALGLLYRVGLWTVLSGLVCWLIYELGAVVLQVRHDPAPLTLTQRVQRAYRARPYVPWLVLAVTSALLAHFWGLF